MKYNEQENEYIDTPTEIRKENYSFGPIYIIYYDIQFSVILHLEDIEAINALQDGEEYRFIEETNKRYLATRQGDFIFFDNPKNGTILKVPLSELAYDKHDTTNEALSPSDMDLLLPKKTNKRGVKASISKGNLDYGIRWVEFDNNDKLKTKEKFFKSESQRSKFIEKLEAKDNFKEIKSYSNPNKKGVEASYRGEPEDLDILEMIENEWMIPVDIDDISNIAFKIKNIGVYLIHPSLGEDQGPGGITITPKMLNKIGLSMDQFIHWLVANDADDKTNAPRDTKYDNFYAKNE